MISGFINLLNALMSLAWKALLFFLTFFLGMTMIAQLNSYLYT